MNLSCLFCFSNSDRDISVNNISKQNKNSNNKTDQNNSKFLKRETLAVSSEYSELKYWFNELIKYVIVNYYQYNNKEELLETVWNYINITTISEYYNTYKTKYSGEYSNKNMLEFYKTIKNTEFEKDILCIVNIYRFH